MNWLWDFLYKLFHPVMPEPALRLTHPEESVRPEQTVENTSITQIMQDWFEGWKVPADYWVFWLHQIRFKVYNSWPAEVLALPNIFPETPEFVYQKQGMLEINVLAKWLNPGVVSHGAGHVSYALLTPEDKSRFYVEYEAVKSDRLIQYLYTQNTYGLTSIVEAHAEIYRYLGDKMPECLRVYYPKLL